MNATTWQGPLMDRRALLRSAMFLAGASLLPSAVHAATKSRRVRFFSAAQYTLLEEVAELIIPRTDTPGARDAGVPATFDGLMSRWASQERREQFRALLQDIDAAAQKQHGQTLLRLPPEQRFAVMQAYDKTRVFGDPVYRKFKELVLTLYYLSEAGATQELRYEHVPGRWQAALPATPETKAWAV